MNTAAPTFPLEELAEQVSTLLMNGGTLGDTFDYNEQDYEVLYALGHSLYSQGRYADAMKAFGYLVVHNHLEKRFMNAFASSLQMIKSYEEAIKYYSLASVMDIGDPGPTFHTCECLLALGQTDDARQGLAMVIEQCDSHEEYASMKARAEALQGFLESQ